MINRITAFMFIVIAAPYCYAMERPDDLDIVLQKLNATSPSQKPQLLHPFVPACSIATWNVSPNDKALQEKMRQLCNTLHDLDSSNSLNTLNPLFANINPYEAMIASKKIEGSLKTADQISRDSISLQIKKSFTQIRVKPWATGFFCSLSGTQRESIAKSARRYMACLQNDEE